MKRLFPILVVSLLSAACGDAPTTSDVNVAEPKDAALLTAGDEVTVDVPYGNCPTVEQAQFLCYLHESAVLTSYCTYEACFEMSYGEEVSVVAADELGAFPRTWFMWGMGYDVSYSSCSLTLKQHKTRIEIPLDPSFCYVSLEFPEFNYSEHFASDPASGCLGWFECKKPKAP